jgi:hypothetical protein
MNIKSAGLIATLGIVLSIQPARADVVIGTGPADLNNLVFNIPPTTTFGELFTAPVSGTLSSFTMDFRSPIGNLIGGVGVWNGSGVSNVLYTSPVTASALTNTFAPNISVVAGTEYVAFLSVDGVSGVSAQVSIPNIFDIGGTHPLFLDGFVFNNNFGSNTYASSTWNMSGTNGISQLDANFSATFTETVAVPGPTVGAGASSFALAALFLGWFGRRRVKQFA